MIRLSSCTLFTPITLLLLLLSLTMEGRELYFEFRLDFNTSESTHRDIQKPKVWRAHE